MIPHVADDIRCLCAYCLATAKLKLARQSVEDAKDEVRIAARSTPNAMDAVRKELKARPPESLSFTSRALMAFGDASSVPYAELSKKRGLK